MSDPARKHPGVRARVEAELLTLDQLAKASTLALISMLVIIVTVVTQGARVDPDLKGQVRGSVLVNSGIFQAIGVISFGKYCIMVS